MAHRRSPNTALAELIQSAEVTYEALARTVNRVGAEEGLHLRYDRASVARWLAGGVPRGPVVEIVAEALSRRLHRPVTPVETGFVASGGADDATPQQPVDTVAAILELGRADMDIDRRTLIGHTAYSLAALAAIPAWAQGQRSIAPAPSATRIGSAEVEAVGTMVETFSAMDDRFGGGHARSAVAAYIATDLTRWLRADASPQVRRKLHAAAADMLYLAGFMAWDDAAHGLAQRYYLRALDLATEASDATTYATVLRGMSLQAASLGHYTEALHLVESAASAVGPGAAPRMRAFLAGQEAVALAALGKRRGAVRTLSHAESHLERASSPTSVFGGYHHAAFRFQEAHLREHTGDLSGAVVAMGSSNRRRPASERRSRAMTTAHLADYQFRAGHLEASCDSWGAFLDDYPHLVAGRADVALQRARSQVRRYPDNPAAKALGRRISALAE